MKKSLVIISFAFIFLLTMSVVSAGFWDWLTGKSSGDAVITGQVVGCFSGNNITNTTNCGNCPDAGNCGASECIWSLKLKKCLEEIKPIGVKPLTERKPAGVSPTLTRRELPVLNRRSTTVNPVTSTIRARTTSFTVN